MRNRRRWLLALVAAAIAVTSWTTLAPRALGGRVTYIITSGTSMQPGIETGDLVLVRRASRYHVGDVAAYHSADLGTTVLHRIVEVEGDRFVFQGDANSWRDPELVAGRDVLGSQWLRVPAVGRLAAHARGPAGLALALGLLTVGVYRRRSSPRPKHRRPSRRRSWPAPTVVAGGALTVAGLSLAVSGLVRPASASDSPVRDIAYRLDVTTGYSAAAPAGLFDGPVVRTGQPVFVQLTDQLDLRSRVAVVSDAALQLTGRARLIVQIQDDSGWERTVLTGAPVRIAGPVTLVTTKLDLDELVALVNTLETTTGHQRDSYIVAVRTAVDVEGTIAGRPIRRHAAPLLELRLDRSVLRTTAPPEVRVKPDGMTFSQPGSLTTGPAAAPREMKLLGTAFPAVWHGPAGAALTAVGLSVLAVGTARRRTGGARPGAQARRRERHRDLIVAITTPPTPDDRSIVDVTDLDALATVATQRSQPVLEHRGTAGRVWWVIDADVLYRCSEVPSA